MAYDDENYDDEQDNDEIENEFNEEDLEETEDESDEEDAQEELEEYAEMRAQANKAKAKAEKVKKVQKTWKTISAIASALGPIGCIILFVILLIVIVVAVVATIMPWKISGNENSGSTSVSVTSENFYGVRGYYLDAEQARIDLLNNYVAILNDSIEDAKGISVLDLNATPTDDPTDDTKVLVEIEIALPDAEYILGLTTNEKFTQFETENAVAYTLIYNFAKQVYAGFATESQATEFSKFIATDSEKNDLMECLDAIQYFGFNLTKTFDSIGGTFKSNLIDVVVDDADNDVDIKGKTTIYLLDNDGEKTATTIEFSNIQDKVESFVAGHLGDNDSTTEKLYVIDILPTTDGTQIPQKNYVSVIFMANNNLTLSNVSFIVHNADSMTANSNGTDISFSVSDYDEDTWKFEVSGSLNVQKFTNFEETITSELFNQEDLKGKSLYEISRLTEDNIKTKYLETDGNGVVVPLESGLVLKFSNEISEANKITLSLDASIS